MPAASEDPNWNEAKPNPSTEVMMLATRQAASVIMMVSTYQAASEGLMMRT